MQKSIIVAVIGVVVGILGSGAVAAYAVNGNHTGLMKAYAMNAPSKASSSQTVATDNSSMSMSDMTASLKGKTGDAFDAAFLSEMTTHHQGAISMANLALTNAKHQEVKDLAKGIVSAQTSEIQQMMQWQTQWGYKTQSSSTDNMSGMGM